MRNLTAIFVASVLAVADTAGQEIPGFAFRDVSEKSLGLWENGKRVLVYNHGQISKPEGRAGVPRACYIHPLYGLDGEVLTDDFAKDHSYHRGVYWAWPHIKIGEKEYELWALSGELRQVFQRWQGKEASSTGAKLSVENGWFANDKQLVREQVQIEIRPTAKDSRVIDLTLTWTSLNEPLTLWGAEGKSYGGFNFRFAKHDKTVITVPEGSKLSEGATAPAGRTTGDLVVTRLPWADFSDDFAGTGHLSGAAVFVHPQHRDFPPTWMTRHYGLISVGWPGEQPQTFAAGQPITCRYRLWIHRGLPSAIEIQTTYDEYRAAQK